VTSLSNPSQWTSQRPLSVYSLSLYLLTVLTVLTVLYLSLYSSLYYCTQHCTTTLTVLIAALDIYSSMSCCTHHCTQYDTHCSRHCTDSITVRITVLSHTFSHRHQVTTGHFARHCSTVPITVFITALKLCRRGADLCQLV
jgi:hypothetical protein